MSRQQPPWLALQNLHFKRENRPILEDISLHISDGEFTLLTGHNGSGKSSLLRIIAGLLPPQQGLFKIMGLQQSWKLSRRLLRQQICYLHQQPYLFDGSVADNIAYGLKRRGLNRVEIESRVVEALQLISLEHLADRNGRALSGGERQRVAIARAWALSPRLMLLDEPIAGLDKRARRQCHQLINRLHEQQIGVILTSHDPQHGELNFNRHIHLYAGELTEKSGKEKAQPTLEVVNNPLKRLPPDN